MLDCINTLDTHNIDTTEIRNKLKSLEEKHIFEDINKYQLYQNIVQKIIISRIGDDSRSYLTYTLNIDISKLIDSINLDKEEDIYNEINRRLTNIENLLQKNNLSTVEYFKSLRDIQDIDIIYKNNISPKELQVFLENIKIGLDTKIEIFINMLNKGNSKILKNRNNETIEGYPNINLSRFWDAHQERIKQKLFVELKDNSEYDKARELITINEVSINIEKQIPIFIDMLNKGNDKILKNKNKETIDGYPNINLSQFWSKYQERIKQKLFIELKDNSEYDIARQTVLTYFKVSSYEELELKQNKGKQLKELDKMQQELIESIKYIDEVGLTDEEQRKRA